MEFVLTPGSRADVAAFKEAAFKEFDLDWPAASVIHGDRAYTDYQEEDLLHDAGQVVLRPQRKKNTKLP